MELKKSALTIGLLVGIFWAMLAHAGEPFVKGVTEWSFSVGYGENFPTSLKGGNVTEEVKFLQNAHVYYSNTYQEIILKLQC